jgi:hypothetical protein
MKIKIIVQTDDKNQDGSIDSDYQEKYNRLKKGIGKLEETAVKIANGVES